MKETVRKHARETVNKHEPMQRREKPGKFQRRI